jgi:hypothetical protein
MPCFALGGALTKVVKCSTQSMALAGRSRAIAFELPGAALRRIHDLVANLTRFI